MQKHEKMLIKVYCLIQLFISLTLAGTCIVLIGKVIIIINNNSIMIMRRRRSLVTEYSFVFSSPTIHMQTKIVFFFFLPNWPHEG